MSQFNLISMAYLFIFGLFLYVLSLRERIGKLEEKVSKQPQKEQYLYPDMMKAADASSVTGAPQPTQAGSLSPIPPPAAVAPTFTPGSIPVSVAGPEKDSAFVHFFKEDFLVKLGALLLLFAFGWGVSYAFTNNWIGPVGRIAFGMVGGGLILAFGTFWMRKNFHQAAIFLVLGLSVFNLTIFAARFMYDFFTPALALALMFAAVAYVAYLSVQKNSQNLALACLIFASVSPLFTGGEPSTVGLFSYLIIFVLGVLWVVSVRMWHVLTFAALMVVSFYSTTYWMGDFFSGGEAFMGLVFAHLFAVVFFAFNGFNVVRGLTKIESTHIYTELGTGLFLIFWILSVADGLAESLPLMLWTGVYLLSAIYFLTAKTNFTAFYLYGAVGLALGATATSSIFDGQALTIAFTLEAGLLTLLSAIITKNAAVTRKLTLLFVVPIFLSLESLFSSAWNTSLIHKDFFVVLTLVVVLFIIGVALRSLARDGGIGALRTTGNGLLSSGILYGLVLILRSVGVYYDDDIVRMIFIIETGALVLCSYVVYTNYLLTARFSYLLGFSWLLTFPSITSSLWNTGVWHKDFAIIVAFIGTALVVGAFLRLLNKEDPHHEVLVATGMAIYGAVANVFFLIWLVLHAAIASEDVATTISLVIFTVLGLGAYVSGRALQIKHYQYAGGIILGFVIARLLLVDVWEMPLLERFITFFVVGILLISTAFYGRKKKEGE
ncbi:MAG: hypothetical protein RLZZ480_302 [Candidatus Parcubacteria bacterium]|jgi:uncharacterized membrane protein